MASRFGFTLSTKASRPMIASSAAAPIDNMTWNMFSLSPAMEVCQPVPTAPRIRPASMGETAGPAIVSIDARFRKNARPRAEFATAPVGGAKNLSCEVLAKVPSLAAEESRALSPSIRGQRR